MRARARAIGAAALAALAFAAVAAGCKKTPQLAFDVVLPSSIAAQTAWIELGVYPGACPSSDQLLGGVPTAGIVTRVAFKKGDPSPPALGDLPRGTYAFAALARGDDCSVLAGACKVVDVGSTSSIELDLTPSQSPTGGCGTGTVCEDAICVPSNDNGNPTLGAGCSLQLVGAGPLGDPLTFGGTLLSAPAVAVTESGFLVAYREYDPTNALGRLTAIPIDPGGGAGPAQQTTLPGQCGQADESDATALAYVVGKGGTIVLARPPCNGNGGFDVFEVDATGAISMSGFNAVGSAKISLSNAHALAPAPAGDGFLLAFEENGQAQLTSVSGVMVGGSATSFGGAGQKTAAWVATSTSAVGLLAAGPATLPPAPVDAGDDGGAADDGGAQALGTLRLSVAAPGADLATLPAPTALGGTFGALAAKGARVFVVYDSGMQNKPVAWRAFDVGGANEAASDSFATQGLGKVLYADVALANDRAIFAVEQPGSISLAVYDHASTQPVFLRDHFLPDDARIPSQAQVRDGRVAVAASATRVAVAWTTAKQMGQNDDVGGYAVFACTTP